MQTREQAPQMALAGCRLIKSFGRSVYIQIYKFSLLFIGLAEERMTPGMTFVTLSIPLCNHKRMHKQTTPCHA